MCMCVGVLASSLRRVIRGLSEKFVQYVYKNFILQIFRYVNVVPFKILPIRHNTFVPPPFPLLEACLGIPLLLSPSAAMSFHV